MEILQAIHTKYIGPSNVKGSRVKVTAYAGIKYYHWNDALDVEDNHHQAALKYMVDKGWAEKYSLIGGGLKDGYCWVQLRRGK